MKWYVYVAYFFGGAFLTNAVPHCVNGISGHPFPTPFASPPGQGLSSPTVNVLWASLNVVIGYLLIAKVGTFNIRQVRHALLVGAGSLLMSIMLAQAFGDVFGG
jgi:hypothetical protein